MAETGDWVTPRLYGRPWFEKPPLLYWGGAIFFKLIPNQPEIAARLPSAISALLATLALAWLAWRTYGEECARWLLLLLPTSVGMIGFSHACATDMPFGGTLTIALVCAAVILGLVPPNDDTPILPRTPWLALLLFGFFMGLAVLAKGPAGIILMGGAVFFWTLFTKRWRDAFRLLHPAAIATFCVTALPWYTLCARRNPGFFRVFIIEHNFKRYLTPEFQHIQPFWFYIPVLLVAFLPWTSSLFAAFPPGFRKTVRSMPTTHFLLTWSLFCLFFFSVSKSKLPGYILPAIPPLAVLLALANQGAGGTRSRWVAITTGALLLVIGRAIPFGFGQLGYHNPGLPGYSSIALIFSYLSGLAVILLAALRKITASFTLAASTTAILVFTVLSGDGGRDIDARLSSRRAASKYLADQRLKSTPDPFTYDLPRSYQYGLNFYFHKELPLWSENDHNDVTVFVTPYSRRDYLMSGLDCRGKGVWPAVVACRPTDSLGGSDGGRKPD